MEELKKDVKKVGKETKDKVKEKIGVASEFASKVAKKEYTFSGDTMMAAGALAGLILGKLIKVNHENKKQQLELEKRSFTNGVLEGRISEMRHIARMEKQNEKTTNSQE